MSGNHSMTIRRIDSKRSLCKFVTSTTGATSMSDNPQNGQEQYPDPDTSNAPIPGVPYPGQPYPKPDVGGEADPTDQLSKG